MMRGAGDVVAGWQNKLQTAIASVTPAGLLAAQHRRQAKPGQRAEVRRPAVGHVRAGSGLAIRRGS